MLRSDAARAACAIVCPAYEFPKRALLERGKFSTAVLHSLSVVIPARAIFAQGFRLLPFCNVKLTEQAGIMREYDANWNGDVQAVKNARTDRSSGCRRQNMRAVIEQANS